MNMAFGLQKKNIYLHAILAVSSIVLFPILIPWFSVMGAIIGKFLTLLIASLPILRAMNQFLDGQYLKDFFVRYSVLAIAVGVLIFFLPLYTSFIVSLLIAFPIFVAVLLGTKIVTTQEYKLLMGSIRRR
jgi:O-antigen/teichoic acid export membrane protein